MICSRLQAVREDHRGRLPAERVEHLPVPLLRRRQLVERTTRATASSCSSRSILPDVNHVRYGQVESPYGSGQFIKDLREHFGERRAASSLSRDRRQGRHRATRSRTSSGRASRACHASERRCPPDLRDVQDEIEGYARELRPRLLRDHLRGARLRPAERDRRLRRLPDALPALALRMEYEQLSQELRVRPVEDLRDGDQQRPLLRLPARGQRRRSIRSW